MSATSPASQEWTNEVIAFLSETMPRRTDQRDAWDHIYMSAFEMGCAALIALGQADEAPWGGAVPRKHPSLPTLLPRWDDICASVLSVARQQGRLQFRRMDGSPLPPRIFVFHRHEPRPSLPPPNVVAGAGLGPASADDEALRVLGALSLVSNGAWTTAAETVLWRQQPAEWEMNVTSDPRFAEASSRACDTVPDDVRREMDRLATISDREVEEAATRAATWLREMRAKYGPKAQLSAPTELADARRSLKYGRPSQLDWLFYRRWRLDDGWLTIDAAKQALEIFHDPLGYAMRNSVMKQLYPDVPFLLDPKWRT